MRRTRVHHGAGKCSATWTFDVRGAAVGEDVTACNYHPTPLSRKNKRDRLTFGLSCAVQRTTQAPYVEGRNLIVEKKKRSRPRDDLSVPRSCWKVAPRNRCYWVDQLLVSSLQAATDTTP